MRGWRQHDQTVLAPITPHASYAVAEQSILWVFARYVLHFSLRDAGGGLQLACMSYIVEDPGAQMKDGPSKMHTPKLGR